MGFLLVCLDFGLELGGDYSGGLLRRVCRRFLGVSVGGGFWVENLVDRYWVGHMRRRQGMIVLLVCLNFGSSLRGDYSGGKRETP